MANSLEAALNRQIKKHFPDEEDNSDEDFEEELARNFKKKEKGKKRQPSDFVPVGTEFAAHELLNHMNGGMMPPRGPSGLPFHPSMYFAPDGRPMYPPQFYQNAYSQQQQAYAHYQQQLQSQHMQNPQLRYGSPRGAGPPGMPHGAMHGGPAASGGGAGAGGAFPQGMADRMPFGASMEEMSRRQATGDNDHRALLHQHRPISTAGESCLALLFPMSKWSVTQPSTRVTKPSTLVTRSPGVHQPWEDEFPAVFKFFSRVGVAQSASCLLRTTWWNAVEPRLMATPWSLIRPLFSSRRVKPQSFASVMD